MFREIEIHRSERIYRGTFHRSGCSSLSGRSSRRGSGLIVKAPIILRGLLRSSRRGRGRGLCAREVLERIGPLGTPRDDARLHLGDDRPSLAHGRNGHVDHALQGRRRRPGRLLRPAADADRLRARARLRLLILNSSASPRMAAAQFRRGPRAALFSEF